MPNLILHHHFLIETVLELRISFGSQNSYWKPAPSEPGKRKTLMALKVAAAFYTDVEGIWRASL